MTYLLYNQGIYYKENQCVLFNKDTRRVYQRNTCSGKEKTIGEAKTLKEAKRLAKDTIERLKHYYNFSKVEWYI